MSKKERRLKNDARQDQDFKGLVEKLKADGVVTDQEELTGKVLFYNKDKGYGFIGSQRKDYFYHVSYLVNGLVKSGDVVKFMPVTKNGKLHAQDVKRAGV